LTALKCALLLADYDCIEWEPDAGPASSDDPVVIAGPADSQNPTAGGTCLSKSRPALPSLVLPPLSMLFESSQGKDQHNSSQVEGRHHSSSEAQQHDADIPPADPSQRIIITSLVQGWKDHQYMLGHVVLARSEEYSEASECAADPSSSKR